MLLITVLIALVSGVKGVFLAEFMALTLIVFYDKRLSKTVKVKAIFAMVFVFAVTILITLNMSPFKELIRSDRFLAAIFSYRIDYLYAAISTMTKENFSILIGGTGLEKIRLELQLVDIILFFGAIGLMVYTYFIYHLYKIIRKNHLAIVFLITTLTVSIFIGNLFYIPLSSFLFILTLFCLNEKSLRELNY
jgi:hypothetical protein